MYKDLETWESGEVGYIKSWDWRSRVDQMETGLYPVLKGWNLFHGQWISSEVLQAKLGSRKTNLVALWKMDLERTWSQEDQLRSCL